MTDGARDVEATSQSAMFHVKHRVAIDTKIDHQKKEAKANEARAVPLGLPRIP